MLPQHIRLVLNLSCDMFVSNLIIPDQLFTEEWMSFKWDVYGGQWLAWVSLGWGGFRWISFGLVGFKWDVVEWVGFRRVSFGWGGSNELA